ncbi:hypothetical protein M9Y10_036472 [Tritrichomonas musculus]|uniref:Uncharacterized protein n=1 Tax=Tritrichomonas musculus TaxID=1915356 RepID=A0ABR2GU72_9EUKA
MEERIQILLEHLIDEKSNSSSISNETKSILSDFNISEIRLLSILSQKLKIDQNNVDNIIANSKDFECLKELCLLYKDIVENSSIKQKNFVNILIIDHLLLNITESNIEEYVICANLF